MPKTSFNTLRTSNHKVLREAGGILREAFSLISFKLAVGQRLGDIDSEVGRFLRKHNASSTARLLGSNHHFSACLNYEVINGVPDDRVISEGDLVTIDMSMFYRGVFVDKAISVVVSPVTGKKKYLVEATYGCLKSGISSAFAGCTNVSIGTAIETVAHYFGMTPSSRFSGHGIGMAHHMEPVIPNVSLPTSMETILEEGQSIAIEPVLFFENKYTLQHVGSTIVSSSLCAHVEDTIIIHDKEAEVIT